MPHKFKVGQTASYHPAERGQDARTRQLPIKVAGEARKRLIAQRQD